jgi:hypothetical protein
MSDTNERSVASAGSVDALSALRSLVEGVRGMGIGDPDCGERVEASDIVRWAVDEIEQLRGSMEWYKDLLLKAEEKMVRMSLTDAEREAVEAMAGYAEGAPQRFNLGIAPTLRGLLERTQ